MNALRVRAAGRHASSTRRWRLGSILGLCLSGGLFSLLTAAMAASPLPVDFAADGWTQIADQSGIVVEMQAPNPGGHAAYRAQGILKAPVEQILAVLEDNATAADWMPDLAQQELVDQRSALERVTRSIYALPFPFADRELVLQCHLFFDREAGDLVADAVSIDHPRAPLAKGRVRAHMVCSRTRLRPLGPNRTAVDFLMLVDPRGRIPVVMAAFGLRQAPFKFVKALEARAQTAGYPLPPAYQKLLTELQAGGPLETTADTGTGLPKEVSWHAK
ncbi:MAG: START domain-containing protein [Desulfosarcinaceae bacterium]|nr:START domain-containing protein [Desulfosarcinaceae bacterium]